MTAPLPRERDAYIQKTVNDYRMIAGSGLTFDEVFHKNVVTCATERSFYPQGLARQIVAQRTRLWVASIRGFITKHMIQRIQKTEVRRQNLVKH